MTMKEFMEVARTREAQADWIFIALLTFALRFYGFGFWEALLITTGVNTMVIGACVAYSEWRSRR